MQELNDFLSAIDGFIGGSQWFVFALLGTGLFFTIYLKFPQIRYFGHALRSVRGKYDKEGDEGDTSHFQALTTALSGTVGTGNIAGVAYAIHLGGPPAIFWMIVTAFLGMTTKFVEVTLSHKYREKDEEGKIAGGPMYYMKNKLNYRWLAVIFALATILSSFGTGNMPQINSISTSMYATFGINQMLTGAVLAIILGFVIIGGITRIAKVTEKLVPFMAAVYIIGALAVIFYNIGEIPSAFAAIFSDLFTGTAATGGFLGASIAFAFNRGVNRGLFSNEAGQGSAPIAHAAARAHEPVSEGLVAILEPFIDTIIICSITGLVILTSGVWNEKMVNRFESADLMIFNGSLQENDEADVQQLYNLLVNGDAVETFSGQLMIENGKIQSDVTLLHARSIAEHVEVTQNGRLFNGEINITDGKLDLKKEENLGIVLRGESLVHSAPLTAEAFNRSYFGSYGQYIISIGLLLFAFSTAISWSYYGDRATTYLFGVKYVNVFRLLYVVGFFLASFADTTIIWTLSGITIALMTLPNLFGILMLSKDMKRTVKEYWQGFHEEYPDEKIPERLK
ncbi:alanine/glycine:cation symporter family protein [Catalinimonas niigatensis]|uniref:alanine/glycine:cation symporter family protein n=1 Tax=Catalinimonas niigatensis TaxID=1397264 RepID=UPI0026655EF2|nr:sodium:alanine symporter family protein [Catalinimonas niigatensis]WPP49496.1 sodium:alanine symporter family protein [Catalinimonas niigatensis]